MADSDFLAPDAEAALPAETAAAPPDAAKSIDELIAETGGGANAIFDFQHKVFALPGARFGFDYRARAAMFYIHLGKLDVALTPIVVQREFNIEAGSHDSQLMELAARGLRYVKEIRPGDSIPKELIDGTASWTVEDRHRLLAKAKLLAQVTSWFTHDKSPASLESILAMSDKDVAVREEFQNAFASIAQSLGLGRERKQEIIDHIDTLARELCYIEALRDHAGQMRVIHEKIMQLARIARGDREVSEELTRVLTLMKQPLAEFANRFMQIDAETSDLLVLLRNPRGQIHFIRNARDDVHANLMVWSEIFERWQEQEAIFNQTTDGNIKLLHRLLASNYAPAKVWR